jgi:hypothetical protein
MSVSTGTSAENFWDDGLEEEAECEKFLQEQKTKVIEYEEEETSAELAGDDEDEDEEYEEDEEEEDVDDDIEDAADVEEEEDDDVELPETDHAAEEEDSETENDPVADAEDADATKSVKGKKMAKPKTRTGGKTKAEAIREVIDRRKRAGESLRPRDIIEELTDNGFAVNASQVSVTLRSMGVPPAPKGRIKGTKIKPATPGAEPKSRMALKTGVGEKPAHNGKPADAANMVDMAVEFLKAAGGHDKAVELLDSIARFAR